MSRGQQTVFLCQHLIHTLLRATRKTFHFTWENNTAISRRRVIMLRGFWGYVVFSCQLNRVISCQLNRVISCQLNRVISCQLNRAISCQLNRVISCQLNRAISYQLNRVFSWQVNTLFSCHNENIWQCRFLLLLLRHNKYIRAMDGIRQIPYGVS